MAKRFYYKPSNNVNEDRKEFLKVNSELLELALSYIWYKEYGRSKNGDIKYIDKKQFRGKVVKQEYHNHINTLKNKIRKRSRNSLSEDEAKDIIVILKDALNYEEDEDQFFEGEELIDFIFKLTKHYIQLYKHEEGMKRLLDSNISAKIGENSLQKNFDTKKEDLYRYYWLNVDPNGYDWSFSDIKIGRSQTYSNLNSNGTMRKNQVCFSEIQIDDFVVAYETGSVKAITTLCKVADKYKEDNEILVEFKKIQDFENPLALDVMKQSEDLQDCEVVHFHRGTLFKLEKGHYEKIINMLNKINTWIDLEEKGLYKAVNQSLQGDIRERKQRLRNRISPFPSTYETVTRVFQRNPDVIAEVLTRAKGICEKCEKDAPFKRSSDGTPYLEVHHIKRLADGGEDTVENAIAVCPNCHRELHFG